MEIGSAMLVASGSEGGLRFVWLGALSGRLLPLAPDRFRVVCIDPVPSPVSTDVRFLRDAAGRVTSLEMTGTRLEHGNRARRLGSWRFRQEELRFRSGKVELHGRLIVPTSPGPHPAVVFVHGTGYQTGDRRYELELGRRLLDRGLAIFTFDKRGCGRSSGDWRQASLDDLADDASAAVTAVRRRAGVDTARVGVYGVSEGGWVAPAVATRNAGVAFVVDQGGPFVSPLADERDDLASGVAALRFPPADRAIAMDLARAMVDLYRTADAYPDYLAALERARARPWFATMRARLPESEDDVRVRWWRKRGRFDPASHWSRLAVPALVLIGERDATMDVARNMAGFEAMQRRNPRIDVRVVPGADHGLMVDGRLAPGFPDLVSDWILAQ